MKKNIWVLLATAKSYYNDFLKRKKRRSLEYDWRKKNEHNYVDLNPLSDPNAIEITKIGRMSYGSPIIKSFGNTNNILHIGSFVSIADEVIIMLAGGHHINNLSTYPFKHYFLGENESLSRGDVVIEDDVWIGMRSIVMSGVTIGRGAIVAAGAVVTKDVPPYSIVAGVPAKVIKFRFSENIINCLKKIDYNKLSDGIIVRNIDILYKELRESEDLDQLENELGISKEIVTCLKEYEKSNT